MIPTFRKTLLPALLVLAPFAYGQTNFQWTGGAAGDWGVRTNWSDNAQIPTGKYIGESGTSTTYDRVTIDGASTVSFTGDVAFQTSSTSDTRKGRVNSITLQNGAALDITGRLTLTSSSGNYVRDALIDTGSSLTVTELRVGTSNSSGAKSTWTIRGAVNATTFEGVQASATSGLDGGYILNVDGGSLSVSGNFGWKHFGNSSNLTRVGQINISNGGVVDIGTMGTDWTSSPGNFVNFVNGSGSLKFGYTNWDLDAVNGLIANGYIRKDASVTGMLQVVDATDGWLVTVNQIPETSTTVALFSAVALGAVCVVKRRRNRA